MRKFISLFSAAAMLASLAVVPMAANAALDDVLMEQNFDDSLANWGSPSRKTDKAYGEYIDKSSISDAAAENMPSSVEDGVMHYYTTVGQDISVGFTMNPALSGTADVYKVTFDTYLNYATDGYPQYTDQESIDKCEYTVGFGDATFDQYNNAASKPIFEFKVKGQDIQYSTAGTYVSTGLTTGETGIWLSVELNCNMTTKKVSGKLTPQSGDAVVISSTDFSDKAASTIAYWCMKAIRFDGTHKGHVNGYLDNFVVTESAAAEYKTVTINFTDGTNAIKDPVTDQAVAGEKYSVPVQYLANIAAEDESKYYAYTSGGEDIDEITDDTEIDLVFTLTDKVAYSVKAVSGGTELADIASGYVIPGEKVTAYGKYSMIADGAFYAAEDTKVTYEPTAEAPDAVIEYTELSGAEGDCYDYDTSEAAWTLNDHMNSQITGVDEHDTNVIQFSSTGSGESKFGTALMDLSSYADYKTIYLNYDSVISDGRFTLSIFDKPISGYSDAGLFSIGIKDSRGYRINGTENAAGKGVWTSTSVKVDLGGGKLYYQVLNTETGSLLASGSNDITAETVAALGLVSWLDSSAAVDNIDVIAADKDAIDAEYDFEDDEDPFVLDNPERGSTEVVEADGTVVTSGHALKFAADDRAGTSVPETATFDFTAIAAGASKLKIQFDSYVPETNAMIRTKAANGETWLTQGYGNGYYRIDGESRTPYTSAAGAWVKTVINIDLDTGEAVYTLYNAAGTQLYSGKKTVDAHVAGKLQLEVTAADAVVYIDNISVKATKPEAAELSDELFTTNDHATTMAVGGDEAPVVYDGDIIKFTADGRTGATVPATAAYDISDITKGKGYIIISYDSYVDSHSVTLGVDDIFKQGYGKDFYRINDDSNKMYTGANGAWVHTDLLIDLNAGKERYALSWTEDGEDKSYSGSNDISATAVNKIVIKAASADAEAYISNITVTALGEYIPEIWTKYTAVKENGVLKSITMERVTDLSSVILGEDEYLWNQDMVPYVAAE